VIKTFADRDTRTFWETGKSKRMPPSDLRAVARRKLLILNSAANLQDLRRIPGNRLEPLRHDRAGQYSIRLNDQFRVCFRWKDGDAFDVEIVDYH
jgi:proteic killer suppression protein